MAERGRINLAEKTTAVNDLITKADDAWNYIDNELSNLVTAFASWWEGDAYKAFIEDWNATKNKFKTDIYEEIKAYAKNLDTAVEAQSQQDVSNVGSIKIN